MHEAAVEGLLPWEGWQRTPGELAEYINAARERRRREWQDRAYLAYDLGVHIAKSVWDKPEQAWIAFKGFLPMPRQTDDQLLAALEAWADCKRLPEEEDTP